MKQSGRNKLSNVHNQFQGPSKRILCLCSAGLLRSPTTAVVLASEFGCNTRAAGLSQEYALIFVDDALLLWADEIIVMDDDQRNTVLNLLDEYNFTMGKPIHVFNIPDIYNYMDIVLVENIREEAEKAGFIKVNNFASIAQLAEATRLERVQV